MKYLLTVLASVVLALLATWYAIAARVKMLERAPEQASVLVLPGPDGACVPRVARPVVWAHIDDAIEWRAVELPGCEGQGAFALDSSPDDSRLFSPLLRGADPARERTLKVTHGATSGVSVDYTVELPGCEGQGAFALDSSPGDSQLFSPLLRGAEPARERTLKVTHAATAGVSVTYTVELPNGRKDAARVSFF